MMKSNITLSLEATQEEYFDPRLLAAQNLLKDRPTQTSSMVYPLIASVCMAGASLLFVLSVVLGPGWDLTGQGSANHAPMVQNSPERINGQRDEAAARIASMARASEFEISANPADSAISASEAEGLAAIRN